MAISRRDAIKFSGLAAIAATTVSVHADSNGVTTASKRVLLAPAPVPAPKGKRVVIVGAGPSGLTIAKYIKKGNPKIDVVLIDKRS
ncbi:MAG: NAD(P)-binding protein, partial [Sulfurovaceae bacterium]|nr:NAD(P)-binding protein [Sulfurovaceae bacterium]